MPYVLNLVRGARRTPRPLPFRPGALHSHTQSTHVNFSAHDAAAARSKPQLVRAQEEYGMLYKEGKAFISMRCPAARR